MTLPPFTCTYTHSTKTINVFSFWPCTLCSMHQIAAPLLPGFQQKLCFTVLSIAFPCSEGSLIFGFRLPPLPVQLQFDAKLRLGLIHLSLTSHFGQLFRRIQTNHCAKAKNAGFLTHFSETTTLVPYHQSDYEVGITSKTFLCCNQPVQKVRG